MQLSQHECFYLCLKLHEVRGPMCFQDLKTVDGQICATYRETCLKHVLFEDGAQWDAILT